MFEEAAEFEEFKDFGELGEFVEFVGTDIAAGATKTSLRRGTEVTWF